MRRPYPTPLPACGQHRPVGARRAPDGAVEARQGDEYTGPTRGAQKERTAELAGRALRGRLRGARGWLPI